MRSRPPLRLLVLFAAPAVASAALRRLADSDSGDPNCPCLTPSQLRTNITGWSDGSFVNADGTTKVTLSGIDYRYPADYGIGECAQHDAVQPPFCNVAEPPEWCTSRWCYVDASTCTSQIALRSSYFAGVDLRYSYAACGSKNSFLSWFGANAAADGSHAITDIADLLTEYLTSIVSTLELNQKEVANAGASCEADSSCPCATCKDNPIWRQAIDVQTVTIGLGDGVDPGSAAAQQDVCLASIVSDSFTRIAANEANVTRIGYEYYGSQAIGAYTQWPGLQWCLGSYDPRFRPWYAGAASGPKDVVLVIDKSGSMSTGGRMEMAIEAAIKVVDTLTAVDFVSVVEFSTYSFAYGEGQLVPATAANRQAIKEWVGAIRASGSTDFGAAFATAWDVFRAGGGTSGCDRVLLFLTDGKPDAPWGDEQYASVAARAAELDVHLMSYALGAGADASVTKRLACEGRGIAHAIADAAGDALANAMASYYRLLAPMLSPCRTRWVSYSDVLTGTELLGACMAAFETLDGSTASSCEGGLEGIGEGGDARTPALLGVACIDMNLIVELETIRARADWADFDARVQRERAACPRVKLTEAQLETLRLGVSEAAVCGAVPASAVGGDGGDGGGGSSGGAIGGAIGGVLGGLLLLGLACWARATHVKRKRAAASRSHTTTAAASPTVVQGVPMGMPIA